MKSYRLSQVVTDFLQYHEVEKNNSQHTIIGYRHYLNRFAEWLGKDMPMQKLDLKTFREFRLFLNRFKTHKGKLLSTKTQKEHLTAIRSLLFFCHDNDIPALPVQKIVLPKVPKTIVTFLYPEEVERILQTITGNQVTDLRDYAIIQTLFSTGLRVGELCSLDKHQVDLEQREFTVMGKGKKPRLIFLSQEATAAIKKYLDMRNDDLAPLFINHASNNQVRGSECRLTHWAVAKMVRGAARAANINKKVSPHTFRHSFATDLLNNGADMRAIQELLGHASIRTTEIYTHVTNYHLKTIFFNCHNKKSLTK